MKKKFSYDYERPAVTVDCVVFGVGDGELKVLCIRRAQPPFQHNWALPGGFLEPGEAPADAAARELREETGLRVAHLEQLYTYGQAGRDPRGWVISIAHYALVREAAHVPRGGSDAEEAMWLSLPDAQHGLLAFDHQKICADAIERLRAKIRYTAVGFQLLPTRFSLGDLHRLHESVLGRELDRRNFCQRILKMGILIDDGQQEGTQHRPARLYRFDRAAYQRAVKDGLLEI